MCSHLGGGTCPNGTCCELARCGPPRQVQNIVDLGAIIHARPPLRTQNMVLAGSIAGDASSLASIVREVLERSMVRTAGV